MKAKSSKKSKDAQLGITDDKGEFVSLETLFPSNELNIPRSPLADQAADIATNAAAILDSKGYKWQAYNFMERSNNEVIFNTKWPGDNGSHWVGNGSLKFDGASDIAMSQVLALVWEKHLESIAKAGPPSSTTE